MNHPFGGKIPLFLVQHPYIFLQQIFRAPTKPGHELSQLPANPTFCQQQPRHYPHGHLSTWVGPENSVVGRWVGSINLCPPQVMGARQRFRLAESKTPGTPKPTSLKWMEMVINNHLALGFQAIPKGEWNILMLHEIVLASFKKLVWLVRLSAFSFHSFRNSVFLGL